MNGTARPGAYTVGLTARGRPELLVTGLPLPRAASLLNSVGAHVAHAAEVPGAGLQVPLDGVPWSSSSA